MSDSSLALNLASSLDTEQQVAAVYCTGVHTPELDCAGPYALDAPGFFTRLQEAANKQVRLPVDSILDPSSSQAGYPANWASDLAFGAVSTNTNTSSVPATPAGIEDIYAFRRYTADTAAGAPAKPGGMIHPDFNDMIKQKLSGLRAKLSPDSRCEERSNLRRQHDKKQRGKMRTLQTTKDLKTKALIEHDLNKLWIRQMAEHDVMEATFQNAHRLQIECTHLRTLIPQAADFFVIYVEHCDIARRTEFYESIAEAWEKGILQHQGLNFGSDTAIPCALEGLPIVHLCMDFVDFDSAFQVGKVTKDHNVMIFDSGLSYNPGEMCLKCLGPEGFRPYLQAAIDSFVAGEPVFDSKMHTDESACCAKPVQIEWLDQELQTFTAAGLYGRTKSKWELTITVSFPIESKDDIRTVELGEVVELVEGPVRDAKNSLERIRVKALKDGVEGWITVAHPVTGQICVMEMETSNGLYECIKDRNKSQADNGWIFLKGRAGRRSAFAQRECAIGGGQWTDVIASDDLGSPDFTTLINPRQASCASDSASSS